MRHGRAARGSVLWLASTLALAQNRTLAILWLDFQRTRPYGGRCLWLALAMAGPPFSDTATWQGHHCFVANASMG